MTSLCIGTWNINGLAPNKSEVELLLMCHNIDILLISETHFTSRSAITIPGYNIYTTNHPDGTAHGGTAVIIKSSVKHHLLTSYQTEHIQATTLSVEDKNGKFNISSIYCPPKHKIKEHQFSHYISTLGKRFIAGGDWNAKHTFWGSRLVTTRGRELKKCVDKHSLLTMSTAEPTHWPSDPNRLPDLIDFFVTAGLSRLYFKIESCLDGSSNHIPVLLTVSTTILHNEANPKLYNKFTDWESFKEQIEANLDMKMRLRTKEDIESATQHLTNTIQNACWRSTPDMLKSRSHPTIPEHIKMKIKEKRRLRRVWQTSRAREDKTALNKAIKDLRKAIVDAENSTLKAQLESLTATKATDYSLWKATSGMNRPQCAKAPIKLDDGLWARTSKQKADAFATHLEKVFTPNEAEPGSDDSHIEAILNQPYQLDLPIRPITPKEILRQIIKLDGKKAAGFDLITKEVLIQLPRNGIVFLTALYNGILRTKYFPELWKVSQIVMIHKQGKPEHVVSSYRPISLLPVTSKLFEKLLLNRMMPQLLQRSVIPDHQFGFRQKHATTEQVHRIYNRVRKSLEDKEYCSAAFLDIQQAFDRVSVTL